MAPFYAIDRGAVSRGVLTPPEAGLGGPADDALPISRVALVVVIVGGLGSLEGAMLGALIVGLLDAYGRWLLPEFSYFVLFGPMAVLLLVRPRGIFGRES